MSRILRGGKKSTAKLAVTVEFTEKSDIYKRKTL